MAENHTTFNKVAEALLMDYSSIYYVNIRTNEYHWYSFDPEFHALSIEQQGEDFFVNMARDAHKVVYEEDRHIFTEDMTKETMLEQLKDESMHSFEYRLEINGKPVWHALRLIREAMGDDDYLILGVLNIDDEVQERQKSEKLRKERQVFNQIAQGLAQKYGVIYYVDVQSGVYTQFNSGDVYGDVQIREDGSDFFAESQENITYIVHPEDQERMAGILDRDYLITKLEDHREFNVEYRLVVDGQDQHTRMSVLWSADKKHFIVGVQNIDDEVFKEQEQIRILKMANELARRDELTGVKNKNAFNEFLKSLQRTVEQGKELHFAIVVFDLNDLKRINDTKGHAQGDEYLIRSCRMICKTFSHSPIFRIGGDEFVAVLMQKDYHARETLFDWFCQQVLEHQKNQDGPVIAAGMSEYDPKADVAVAAVLEQADALMYENKTLLKTMAENPEDYPEPEGRIIPAARKKRLDALFEAFALVGGAAYVYVCDMRYDYSRWSAAAVEYFHMPSEYMYDAGYIWENHIHPEDRKIYHETMDGIFFGGGGHVDMQFRARNRKGDYVTCTGRGHVLFDSNGEGEYFCGTIVNHGLHQSVDTVTGLRNQYAYLEDLQQKLDRHVKMNTWMVGISRFSELNDVYGYQFGNRLLQRFGRYLYEHVGGKGQVYRLDGTKFAVITTISNEEQIREKYEDLREHFRDGFYVDDKYIILELNAGLLPIESFDIDNRTAYSCLNYAYNISKYDKQGGLVRFENQKSSDNEEWIQKIQAIRASITQRFRGYYLAYQPVVDAHSGKLIGAEALLRWQNSQYGQVPPDEFIEVMEKDSLFPELGRWILRTALTDAKKMLKTHPDFVIDVNLAYTQIQQPGFIDEVVAILEEMDFPPQQLCLEITERCRLLDMELLKNVVIGLQAKGVQISLDDFGTGFSSVGIVKELPLDAIKIDRSFVFGIENDERALALIGAFTNTASLYGARVCAEGVENEKECQLLREYPVDSFQGYHYSKPLPFADFHRWTVKHDISLKKAEEKAAEQ